MDRPTVGRPYVKGTIKSEVMLLPWRDAAKLVILAEPVTPDFRVAEVGALLATSVDRHDR